MKATKPFPSHAPCTTATTHEKKTSSTSASVSQAHLTTDPLKFEEFEKKMGKTLFVSATPAEYELEKSGPPVELITRPTGLLDPEIELHPIEGQMQHLMQEAKKTIAQGNRVLGDDVDEADG